MIRRISPFTSPPTGEILRVRRAVILAGALAFALAGEGAAQSTVRSTLIRGALVIDGTGAPARQLDVRLTGDRIVAVGRVRPLASDSVVDARGLTLVPGFIDTHSHHAGGILEHRDALAAVSQGITTIVAGQDGGSNAPLAEFFTRLDSAPPTINVASYAGHGTLREAVMGKDYRRTATPAEVDSMGRLLQREMSAGALGLSTGLEYDPGIYSSHEEVLALARVAAAAGGRYISHVRSEDRHFWEALDELLEIGRATGMPVQVSHIKLGMRALWGQGDSLVAVLDRARTAGIQVTADIYPYTMWHSTLTVLYPERNFTDRAETDFILREVAGPDDLLLGEFSPDTSYAGKTVAQIAELRGTDPGTTLMALIAESQVEGQSESVIGTGMDERDVARLIRWPYANICSDGALNGSHPRGFGAFPRVLGRYVREQHVVPFEEAIRKMTSLAAANVGLPERGTIVVGNYADLVLLDPASVADRATITEPHALSVGISRVWVNGETVYRDGAVTGARPGRALRRPGTPAHP